MDKFKKNFEDKYVNSFHATDPFLYSLKASKNQRLSDVSRGYRKRPMTQNELKWKISQLKSWIIRLSETLQLSEACSKKTDKKFFPTNIYLFKVNNRNTRRRCEICSKLTIKTPERCHWRPIGVFVDNLEHISQPFLVFLLLNFNK